MNTNDETEMMKKYINDVLNNIEPETQVKFESDGILEGYKSGQTKLTLENIRGLNKGEVVWIDHLENGRPRFQGAMRFSEKRNGEYLFEDGSSFVEAVSEDEWDEELNSFYVCSHRLTFYNVVKPNE